MISRMVFPILKLFKQICLTHRWDLLRSYHYGSDGPVSNGIEGVFHTPELEPHHQIPRPFLLEKVLLLCREYC